MVMQRGRPNIYKVIGKPGLKAYGGRVFEEFLPELDWINGRKVYKEMWNNDPVVRGIMFSIEQLLRKVSWRVVTYNESANNVRDADFINECIHDMTTTWLGTLSQAM